MIPAPIDPPEIHKRLWEGFSGSVGWDVGANVGNTIGEMIFRFNDVLAFEPAEESFRELANVSPIGGLRIFQLAISDHEGFVELLAVPSKLESGQVVTATVTGMEWDPRQSGAAPRSVPCRSVDSLAAKLGYPDFLKVDTEGHEDRILLGAQTTLAQARPSWLIEIHSEDLGRFCHSELADHHNYRVEIVRHPHYSKYSDLWRHHYWLRAFPH